MDYLKIKGGAPLRGTIEVSGAKNAALPILFGTLLVDGVVSLENVPDLHDIETTRQILSSLGVSWTKSGSTLQVDASALNSVHADYELVRKMRASVLCLGSLLGRVGKAEVSLPGGCAIGARPVEMHISAMERLGARISIENGYILASAPAGLKGAEIEFRFPSVGATENAMLAATLANGTTKILNAAREPEIIDLANFLNALGANIMGAGESEILIHGVKKLNSSSYSLIGDRIEAGTYLVAGLITKGDITVHGISGRTLSSVLDTLKAMGAGVEISEKSRTIRVFHQGKPLRSTNIKTEPFPGFPTDMQAQLMTACCLAEGESILEETVFENRFMHAPELARLGADIRIEGAKAHITGASRLRGAAVMATDLRASASLVLAGLVAEGETQVHRIYHLDRGYEKLESKLKKVGASIERLSK